MDNQRQPDKQTKTYNSGKYYERKDRPSEQNLGQNSGERKQFSRDKNYQSRDNRSGRDDNRYSSRDNRFQNDRGKPSGGKYFSRGKPFSKKPYGAKSKKPWEKDNRPRIVSDMQITEGKHRGKYLKTGASDKVKPTARRIREVMFRIMFRRIRAKRFLDLCAGAGTMGMEAMSRGALLGTFVERSAKMCSFIRKNMESVGIKEGHGEVIEAEVAPFLKQMKKRNRYWDVVFFDPPFDTDYDETLRWFAKGAVVAPNGGNLVIEHPAEMFFPEQLGVLTRWRVIVQGNTALSFFERKGEQS
jgi:16S rRNA (guanine966-N2)-methyltransferase